jgi:hypothetical protein
VRKLLNMFCTVLACTAALAKLWLTQWSLPYITSLLSGKTVRQVILYCSFINMGDRPSETIRFHKTGGHSRHGPLFSKF